jgi:putative toxin-antitoxin system antitoxin component (TIGR02293 family)
VELATGRVSEILGLKGEGADARHLAAAVERGLPRSALVRTVAAAGLSGKARGVLMYRVVPLATLKRRTRLAIHESEKTERLARVIALAELLWDDQQAAQEFLNTPHPELDGRTPLECAGTELGARQVEDLVMRAAVRRALDLSRPCRDLCLHQSPRRDAREARAYRPQDPGQPGLRDLRDAGRSADPRALALPGAGVGRGWAGSEPAWSACHAP